MTPIVKISKEGVFVDNTNILKPQNQNWLKDCYTHLGIEYAKFFKMDNLSKIAFIAVETLKKKTNINRLDGDQISLLFANKESSTNVDNKYQETLKKGVPSPSLFVYTLPNICTGEIAIFNKWYGSNSFFITDSIEDFPIDDMVEIEFSKGSKACLIGWVESNSGKFIHIEDKLSLRERDQLIKTFIEI